jgi:hypothetical protein
MKKQYELTNISPNQMKTNRKQLKTRTSPNQLKTKLNWPKTQQNLSKRNKIGRQRSKQLWYLTATMLKITKRTKTAPKTFERSNIAGTHQNLTDKQQIWLKHTGKHQRWSRFVGKHQQGLILAGKHQNWSRFVRNTYVGQNVTRKHRHQSRHDSG